MVGLPRSASHQRKTHGKQLFQATLPPRASKVVDHRSAKYLHQVRHRTGQKLLLLGGQVFGAQVRENRHVVGAEFFHRCGETPGEILLSTEFCTNLRSACGTAQTGGPDRGVLGDRNANELVIPRETALDK